MLLARGARAWPHWAGDKGNQIPDAIARRDSEACVAIEGADQGKQIRDVSAGVGTRADDKGNQIGDENAGRGCTWAGPPTLLSLLSYDARL